MKQNNVCSLSLAFILLAGCASQTKLAQTVDIPSSQVNLQDNRSPKQKEQRHDALYSAVAFFADDKFSPSALDLFQSELFKNTAAIKPLNIEVNEFRIADYYPVRLGAGGQGALGSVLFSTLIDKNTDWSFVNDAGLQKNTDSLICIFIGKLNGQPVKVVTSEPYKIALTTILVANDPDYRRALNTVIRRASEEAVRQSSDNQNPK